MMLPITFNGFNIGDLLENIKHIMEDERGEENFNIERIILFDEARSRIQFSDDTAILDDTIDYINVAIIEDTNRALVYAHEGYSL